MIFKFRYLFFSFSASISLVALQNYLTLGDWFIYSECDGARLNDFILLFYKNQLCNLSYSFGGFLYVGSIAFLLIFFLIACSPLFICFVLLLDFLILNSTSLLFYTVLAPPQAIAIYLFILSIFKKNVFLFMMSLIFHPITTILLLPIFVLLLYSSIFSYIFIGFFCILALNSFDLFLYFSDFNLLDLEFFYKYTDELGEEFYAGRIQFLILLILGVFVSVLPSPKFLKINFNFKKFLIFFVLIAIYHSISGLITYRIYPALNFIFVCLCLLKLHYYFTKKEIYVFQ